ncbi:MAG TPA: hypothetical protein VD978_09785 [Azospirillum sp.]|nr:hypothetical protein [Azospirillum sp.]
MRIPRADRLDTQHLLSVVAIPFAAAIAMASAVAATGGAVDRIAEAGGMAGFVLSFVKFCYLAVGMAHLSGAIVEKSNGRLAVGLWLDESEGAQPVPHDADPFWHAFPNHVDGAAIAIGVTMLCLLAADVLG